MRCWANNWPIARINSKGGPVAAVRPSSVTDDLKGGFNTISDHDIIASSQVVSY